MCVCVCVTDSRAGSKEVSLTQERSQVIPAQTNSLNYTLDLGLVQISIGFKSEREGGSEGGRKGGKDPC